MKRYIAFIIGFAFLAMNGPALAQMDASEATHSSETPLMIIRFNQPKVAFARPLYNTISSALQVKPSAMFDIVSITPKASDPYNQPRYDEMTATNTQKVLATLEQIGLPQRRIHTTTVSDQVAYSEVRIYVH